MTFRISHDMPYIYGVYNFRRYWPLSSGVTNSIINSGKQQQTSSKDVCLRVARTQLSVFNRHLTLSL